MRGAPPEVTATWPKPNYDNPEFIGNQLIIVGIVFGAISLVTVCLRLWVRLWMKRNAGWDDLFIVIGLVCTDGWMAGGMCRGCLGYALADWYSFH